MKLIAFSIWGDNPIYIDGMVENISLAKDIYAGWVVRVYHDDSVPQAAVERIKSAGAQTTHIEHSRGAWDGLFWRFYPASESDVDVLIVRDADSRLNTREKAAVSYWLNSEQRFHVMRDHWNHNVPVMGGMWGCKKGCFPKMKEEIEKWRDFNTKGTDQIFLSEVVWPKVRRNTIAHDRFLNGFFRLPNGEIKLPSDVAVYNPWDNCGDDKDYDYPRGKIVLIDGRVFQRLDVYRYHPIELFGEHKVKRFPVHKPMQYGRYVGECSQDFHKPFNPKNDSYLVN